MNAFDCCCREDFIDTVMEESVSRMQAVIELGRVVRDRRTMPMKVRHTAVIELGRVVLVRDHRTMPMKVGQLSR